MKKRNLVDWGVMYFEFLMGIALVGAGYISNDFWMRIFVLLALPLPIGAIIHIWKTP